MSTFASRSSKDSPPNKRYWSALPAPSASAVAVIAVIVTYTWSVQAQKEAPSHKAGVSQRRMEQGEAMITVRSDVRLEMKGTRGATKAQVTAIGEAIRGKMVELKKCYGKLVAEDPAAAVGAFRLVVAFENKRRLPVLEYPDTNPKHVGLLKCIERSLGEATFRGAKRPAAAILRLDFANTRAQGQATVDRANDASASVKVTTSADGSLAAAWKTEDGKLALRVSGTSSSSDRDTIAAVAGGLKRAYGAFLDCRRLAAKRGTSPAGKTVTDVRLKARERAIAKNRSTTLKLARAATCIERVIGRLRFKGAKTRSLVQVAVIFIK